MDILRAGAQLFTHAKRDLDVTATQLAREPGEAKHLIDLHVNQTQAQVGTTLMRRGEEMHGHLLDVLA